MDKGRLVQQGSRWLIILTLFLGVPLYLAWLFAGTWIVSVLNKAFWVFGFAACLAGLKWTNKLGAGLKPVPARTLPFCRNGRRFVLRKIPQDAGRTRKNLSQTVKLILEPVGDYVQQQISLAHEERAVLSQTVRLILTEQPLEVMAAEKIPNDQV